MDGPFETLEDAHGGGLWPGLHVLVGRTGTGKTQFCLQIALHAARAGAPVLFITDSINDDLQMMSRGLGLATGRLWSQFYHGKDRDLDQALRDHQAELEALPLHVVLNPPYGWKYDEFHHEIAGMRQDYPESMPGDRPLFVVFDLQIIGDARAVADCSNLAREFNAVVLVASCTSEPTPEALGKGDPSRLVVLGEESIDLAHSVMVLNWEPWPTNEMPEGGTVCHLALTKNRFGRPAWIKLRFDGNRFTEPD